MAPTFRSDSRAVRQSTGTYRSVQKNLFPESYSLEPRSETNACSTATSSDARDAQGATVRKSRSSRRDDVDKHPTAFQMVRQDSGYESSTPTARVSTSSRRQRTSSKTPSKTRSKTPSTSDRTQERPGLRRSAASNPVSRMPGRSSLTINRPSFLTPQQQANLARKNSYFQFPAPENLEQEDDQTARPSVDLAPVILKVNTANLNSDSTQSPDPSTTHSRAWTNSPITPRVVPPPTTHYWTSDQTRQLEYAAIDAASKGVRGWIMRHIVPDCFVPRNHRRAGFDDDGGSVRRYRIELEIEYPEESVPPSPVGEQLRGFRARGARRSWWSMLKGCNA